MKKPKTTSAEISIPIKEDMINFKKKYLMSLKDQLEQGIKMLHEYYKQKLP